MHKNMRRIITFLTALCALIGGPAITPASAIEGGNTSVPHLATGAAQIWRWTNGDFVYTCTGAVVGPRLVLTAAHCLESGKNAENYVLRLGDTTLASGYRVEVEALDTRYDLALLVMKQDVRYWDGVKHVNIFYDSRGEIGVGEYANVYGWGKTCQWCDPSRELKNARVRIVDDAAKDAMGGPAYAVNAANGARIHKGDSGGPMVKNLPDGGTALVGVASTSEAPSNPSSPRAKYVRFDPNNMIWLKKMGVPLNEEW